MRKPLRRGCELPGFFIDASGASVCVIKLNAMNRAREGRRAAMAVPGGERGVIPETLR